jgi:hypothetical protein
MNETVEFDNVRIICNSGAAAAAIRERLAVTKEYKGTWEEKATGQTPEHNTLHDFAEDFRDKRTSEEKMVDAFQRIAAALEHLSTRIF